MADVWDRLHDGGTAKRYARGTHRVVPPEQTLRRIEVHLADLGITRIANVTGLDRLGVPVVTVCRPNARSVAVSQGKGLTLAAAKASGVMESVELHHAERIQRPLRFATAAEMAARGRIADLDALPRVRDREVRPHQALLWIEGYDLLQREPVWLPYELVNLNTVAPPTPGGECFSATSNGLASGNHQLEAILHGICEVVERDATTLWYLSSRERQAASRIDASTVDDPDCAALLARLDEAGIDTLLWDLSSDLGLPAFHCMITDQAKDPTQSQYTSSGYGCHLSRAVALLRAVTEAAQSRLTLISGSRDDVFHEEYEPVPPERIAQYQALRPDDREGSRFTDLPSFDTDSLDEDLGIVLDLLRRAAVERVIAVDLSEPDLGIPVARVVIPGLEGPMPGVEGPRGATGFTPGRRARELLQER